MGFCADGEENSSNNTDVSLVSGDTKANTPRLVLQIGCLLVLEDT